MQEYEPIDPFARRRRKRLPARAWVLLGLLLYVAFVATTFYMESFARARFAVPSKADIESITDRKARIRAEAARMNALAEMRSWAPYGIYSIASGLIAIGGSLAATIVGTIAIWRGVRRDSVFKAKVIAAGVLIVMMVSLVLFSWPSIVAERRCEATRTAATRGS